MKKQNIGNLAIALLVALNLLLWLFFTPQKSQVPPHLHPQFQLEIFGEMLSTSAVVLFACALVLANKPRFLEPYFGGLDKMYITHKNIAILAVIIIVGHELWVPKTGILGPGLWLGQIAFAGILAIVVLTVGPRVPFLSRLTRSTYSGWLKVHRWVGLFFMLAMPHLIMVDPVVLYSPVLMTYTTLIYSIGTGAYLYKEFLWLRLQPYSTYLVESVRKLNGSTIEVVLQAKRRKLVYQAGQFLFIYFDGDAILGEQHPFTISSAPKQEHLHLSIKASGDWTGYLQTNLKPGTIAHVDGPYGMFNYKTGASKKQVWMAGGIGITPFLSWMRDFNGTSPEQIDFFYTANVPTEALYLNEINKAAALNENFKAHISFSSQDGRLSAQKIIESSGPIDGKEIYMCGPFGMVMAFRDAFIEKGAKAANIHYEEFNFR